MAGQGSNNSEVVYYQPVGSSTWSEVTATPPGSSGGPVAITGLTYWVGLRRITLIAMVTQGQDDMVSFWWQSLANIGSGPWHQEVLSGYINDTSAPSIVQIGNQVAVAAVSPNYGLQFWWQQIGATGWNSLLGQAPGLVGNGPAMALLASPSDTLGITGGDLVTFTHFVYGGTTRTERTAATGLFGPSSVSTVYDAKDSQYLGLLTAASGGTLYFFWEYLAAPGWNPETVAVPSSPRQAGSAGGYASQGIAITSTSVVITTINTKPGNVMYWSQRFENTGWHKEVVAVG